MIKREKLGGKPQKIAVNEADGQIYVTDSAPGDGSISVFDAATQSLLKREGALFPEGVAVNSATGKVYVAHLGGGMVSPVITGMEIVPSGYRVTISGWTQVGDRLGGRVSVFAGKDEGGYNKAVLNLPDYHYQAPMAIDEKLNRVFLALSCDTDEIVVIDGASDLAAGELKLTKPLGEKGLLTGGYPYRDMAVNPQTGKFFITLENDAVLGFSADTLTWDRTIYLASGSSPQGLTINPADGRMYTANSGKGTLSIIELYE